MNEIELAELIPMVAGVVISLVLAYVPKVRDWWEGLDGDSKRAALGVLYAAVAVGLYVPSCLGGPPVLACDATSIWPLIGAFFTALIANQSMYVLLPASTKARMSNA